ncbi:MAG: F0F1 ATP synthase subunit epsilon [Candidatus Saccharicenans sp.]|nr:F0F1 ATP synthase subunit epsilon [Candidatus Saccharicenans sp.]
MHLRVVSPERVLVEAEVLEVQFPGPDGYLGIWPGHRPLNTFLTRGELIYRTVLGRVETLGVRGGVVQVAGDKIIMFVEMEEDDDRT